MFALHKVEQTTWNQSDDCTRRLANAINIVCFLVTEWFSRKFAYV